METASEIIQLIHEQMEKTNSMATTAFVRSTVTCSLTIGPSGAILKGWITYNDERYGKIYFESGKIREHSGLFAGGGLALDNFMVLVPQQVQSPGKFNAHGVLAGGTLMLQSDDGTPVFKEPLALAGTGFPGWSAVGETHFEKTK